MIGRSLAPPSGRNRKRSKVHFPRRVSELPEFDSEASEMQNSETLKLLLFTDDFKRRSFEFRANKSLNSVKGRSLVEPPA